MEVTSSAIDTSCPEKAYFTFSLSKKQGFLVSSVLIPNNRENLLLLCFLSFISILAYSSSLSTCLCLVPYQSSRPCARWLSQYGERYLDPPELFDDQHHYSGRAPCFSLLCGQSVSLDSLSDRLSSTVVVCLTRKVSDRHQNDQLTQAAR